MGCRQMEQKHYGAIDGLRTIAAIGIVLMHIRANTAYEISGFLYHTVIPSFTNFVFLFMAVSAFGMCCGYYERMLQNRISMAEFYKKRFQKIIPFFAVLVFLDVAMSHSVSALYEGFADLTLLFGLLPEAGNISVIGVGWFLGLIFVFYLCFPFFCCLLENKRRAWLAFGISFVYNFVCSQYFEVGRNNILYSACFFLAGGLIYLYREKIEKMCRGGVQRWALLLLVVTAIIAYYLLDGTAMACLLVSSILLIYAVAGKGGLLENAVTRFFSEISMEIYLSHMLVFRVVEKLHGTNLLGNGWGSYIVTAVLVIGGTVAFSWGMKRILAVVRNKGKEIRIEAQKNENIADK